MGYIVLARKYRPQHFDDVVGQESAAQTLKNAIAGNRVAHAYLFAGPRGVGKTSMARILARALCCVKGPTAKPCGTCELCTSIARGESVDVIEIDAASNRGIDEVRTLRENVKYLPSRCRYKIYIVDEVHMLTDPAFNALLKTLEEPPAHIIFILATTAPHKLPETIRSRCQRLDFKRIPSEKIVETLRKICTAEGIDIDDAALHAIARNARGGMRDSESLLDQLVSFTGRRIAEADVYEVLGALSRDDLFALVDLVSAGKVPQALDLLNAAEIKGIDNEAFLDDVIAHYRTLLLLKLCGADSPLIDETQEDLARLDKQQQALDVDQMLYAVQILSDAKAKIRNAVESRIPVEMALVRLARADKLVPLDDIMRRIEAMEELASGGSPTAGGAAYAGRRRVRYDAGGDDPADQAVAEQTAAPPRSPEPPRFVEPGPDATPWERIVAEVRRTSPMTASALLGIARHSRQIVTVNYKRGTTGFRRPVAEAAVKAVLQTARVEFEEADSTPPPAEAAPPPAEAAPAPPHAAAPSAPQPAQQGPAAQGGQSEEQFAKYYDDPAVRNIVKTFGGRIIGVKGARKCPKD